jgi:hypothetical protein
MSDKKIVPFITRRPPPVGVPEIKAPPRPGKTPELVAETAVGRVADLSGKPKLWMLLGPGNSGKTTYARWLIDRQIEQGNGMLITAVDPSLRSLVSWYGDSVGQPPSDMPARIWLQSHIDDIIEAAPDVPNALIDFGGGGDESLRLIVEQLPDLADIVEEHGIGLVAIYFLTPRVDDIFIRDGLADVGFRPSAEMLVLNAGTADPTIPAWEAFGRITANSAYLKAVKSGAVPVRMPRLAHEFMAQIEDRRIPFSMVKKGTVPEGAEYPPLNGLRRSATRIWLEAMEAAHAAVRSWID